ncbi:hypothetical protein EJ110_NYTH02895 [Nymphaea thermarum]|nr:hypothetical protein EJ110_NYTH02895 [Nymphaea thermarum]
MSISGIQGQLLEVTVVGCTKLKDTEWISRQDPYVCLEYGSTKFRTRTCTGERKTSSLIVTIQLFSFPCFTTILSLIAADGGKNPTFQEKFIFTLIEGLREINVHVWNSNTLTMDDLIGSGRIQLQRVLHEGYDDSSWPLQTKNGRHAGEVRLILHYPNINKRPNNQAMSFPTYAPSAPPQYQSTYNVPYTQPAPSAYPPVACFPNQTPSAYPPLYPPPPVPMSSYPPAPYPPQPAVYPPPPYPPTTYPPATYPPAPYPGYPGTYPPY